MVFPRREPTYDRHLAGTTSAGRRCPSLHRGATLHQPLGHPNQDYFADGITENLTTDLSRIRNSFVIGRNTAFTFKGKNIDTREISKELGVRYVLEGSVQRDQNRVRVNAQLIDGATGAHLWADRFEESITDLFKLPRDVRFPPDRDQIAILRQVT